MNAAALIKAILINAAYEGAVAVCEPLTNADGANLTIDPLIKDVALQKKGVLVYEEAKVQYNALLRAFHDKTGIWPDPKVDAENPLPGVVKAAVDVASAVVPKLPGQELTK
jgi:hypothetical protein